MHMSSFRRKTVVILAGFKWTWCKVTRDKDNIWYTATYASKHCLHIHMVTMSVQFFFCNDVGTIYKCRMK